MKTKFAKAYDITKIEFKTIINKITINPITIIRSQCKRIIQAINSEPELEVYDIEEIEL